MAYYAEIHHISYFTMIQIFVGIFEVKRLYVYIECTYNIYIAAGEIIIKLLLYCYY